MQLEKSSKVDRSNANSTSLNKYISDRGVCSRRQATEMIADGRVSINNEVARPGNRVFEGDVVRLDGKLLHNKPKRIYIALNKPMGIVCTTDSREKDNIIDYIGHEERLFPIGRLDKPSQGLIFLTNDGDIVNKILRAGNKHEKEYIVKVNKPITSSFILKMRKGVPILGTITKKCRVIKIDEFTFRIILVQGLNRQIRRMCEFLGYDVVGLKRVRIMNVTLSGLKIGEWRELTDKEMDQIEKMVSSSTNASAASMDKNRKGGFSKRK